MSDTTTEVVSSTNIHKFFLKQAEHWSTRSTCYKWQVGCVLVLDGRIISTGYNGVMSKAQHCCDYWREEKEQKELTDKETRILHREWSKQNEIHAEQNAILFAARHGVKTEGTFLYVNMSPCIECAKNIGAAGILRVYYSFLKTNEGIEFLEKNGVECIFVSN